MPRGYTAADYLYCPECNRKGVTMHLADTSDHDYWGCKYCDWNCYCSGYDSMDVELRAELLKANPGLVRIG